MNYFSLSLVKYGETLRRFNVTVNEDDEFDLNMDSLKLKICSLFNLPSNSKFNLTYQDEDDDLVTLVDNDDLHDVVKQALDPVRIFVHLNTEKNAQLSSAPNAPLSQKTLPIDSQNLQQNPSTEVSLDDFLGIKKNKDVSVGGNGGFKPELVRNAIDGLKSITPNGIRPHVHPFRSNQWSTVHEGVTCDGCEMVPIAGPRFKSKVRFDYDMCIKCFSEMGNYADYTRIDIPMMYNEPQFKAYNSASSSPIVNGGFIPTIGRNCTGIVNPGTCKLPQPPNMKSSHQKLMEELSGKFNSSFIKDINVMDGTVMAPSTPFMKTWLVSNSGSLTWRHGLKLVWIGGDWLKNSGPVPIQVPSIGVYPGFEHDITVDFIAPEWPGKYISYWRMADASGQKFGQRLWVQIEVDPSTPESSPVDLTRKSSSKLDLNFPPASNDTTFPQFLDVKTEPKIDTINNSSHLTPAITSVSRDQVNLFDCPVPEFSSFPVGPTPGCFQNPFHFPKTFPPIVVSAPTAGADYKSEESSNTPSNVQDSNDSLDVNLNIGQIDDETEGEEKLLKDFDQTGLNQVDLNKESPLEDDEVEQLSQDYLCDVDEWDPILVELKEMGFEDKETNQKLLAKNNGSISRVVMDLIAGGSVVESTNMHPYIYYL